MPTIKPSSVDDLTSDIESPLLLADLPFDPNQQFSSMGFIKPKRKPPRPSHEGRNNRKRDVAKER